MSYLVCFPTFNYHSNLSSCFQFKTVGLVYSIHLSSFPTSYHFFVPLQQDRGLGKLSAYPYDVTSWNTSHPLNFNNPSESFWMWPVNTISFSCSLVSTFATIGLMNVMKELFDQELNWIADYLNYARHWTFTSSNFEKMNCQIHWVCSMIAN